METTFIAPDIECDACAASIKKALTQTPGVETVNVDIDRKAITVGYNDTQTNAAELAATLDDIGFTVASESGIHA